jgi:uncharacterized protein YjiS (DUF1127 family)
MSTLVPTAYATRAGRSWLRRLYDRQVEAARLKRDYEHLAEMSDHELADIGLQRSDILLNRRPWPFGAALS